MAVYNHRRASQIITPVPVTRSLLSKEERQAAVRSATSRIETTATIDVVREIRGR